MEESANLSLPYLLAAQAQKHVTHNEALRVLDCIVHLAVLDRSLTVPPGGVIADGDRYIPAGGATGVWAGHDGEIAAWQDGAWRFYAPRSGWLAWVSSEDVLLVFDGAAWQPASGVASVNPVALVGVNATADGTNRLAVKSNAVLFSHDDETPGTGDMRQVLNKATSSGTVSQLYQSNWSGRAETGLTGDEDFHVKVSADGTTWHDAILIDKATGAVSFPNSSLGSSGGPGGSATHVQYRDSTGNFAGSAALTFNAGTSQLSVTGRISLPLATSAAAGVVEFGTVRMFGRSGSLFAGNTAGNFTQTGAGNIGIGSFALDALTTGAQNVALGDSAGSGLTSGQWNFALGAAALQTETTGSNHVALGAYSLVACNGGSANTAVGDSALRSNTTGQANVGIGRNAGRSFTTGSYNTEIGYQNPGGTGVTTGSSNTIIGARISGLDAALSNTVVLADGAGNKRMTIDSSGHSRFEGIVQPKSYTVAGLPAAATAGAGAIAYVSNESGGAVLAFSDGSAWRRVTDRAVVS
jgi:hypothetical protein